MTKDLKKFWNEKHPKKKIIYGGRSLPTICPTCRGRAVRDQLPIDVRTLITVKDAILEEVIKQHNLKKDTHDETMLSIQNFVCKQIRYIGDEENQGVAEHWQFPFETIALGIGDCEDGAILIASLAIACEIPSYRVRVSAGLVQENETAPTGGHGYCIYLRENIKKDNDKKDSDEKDDYGDWLAIDWCYLPDPNIPIQNKSILKDNKHYKEIWFSFNDEYAWCNENIKITQSSKKIIYTGKPIDLNT